MNLDYLDVVSGSECMTFVSKFKVVLMQTMQFRSFSRTLQKITLCKVHLKIFLASNIIRKKNKWMDVLFLLCEVIS